MPAQRCGGSHCPGPTTSSCSRCKTPRRRAFYEAEALRGGWSVRQLDRQISTKFYERTLLSRNKGAMLGRDGAAQDRNTR